MIRICPKCNYARQASDSTPEWQCPSCHVAYAKVGAAAPSASRNESAAAVASGTRPGFPALKWILAVAIVGLGIWIAKPFEKLGKTSPAVATSTSSPAITLYSAEWCGYCTATRQFFDQNNIQYKEMDIEKTTTGYEEHKRLGGNGVPLVVIGDEVIHGYNEQRMRHTLKPWLKGS